MTRIEYVGATIQMVPRVGRFHPGDVKEVSDRVAKDLTSTDLFREHEPTTKKAKKAKKQD